MESIHSESLERGACPSAKGAASGGTGSAADTEARLESDWRASVSAIIRLPSKRRPLAPRRLRPPSAQASRQTAASPPTESIARASVRRNYTAISNSLLKLFLPFFFFTRTALLFRSLFQTVPPGAIHVQSLKFRPRNFH